MNLLAFIPAPWRLLGSALAVLAITAAAWLHGDRHGLAAGRDEVTSRWNAERAAQAGAAASASEAARFEETRRATAAQEIARAAKAQIDRAHADAVRAATAADGLRQRAAAIAATCGRPAGDPAATPGGQAATGAGPVLADVLGRLEEAGRRLAATADERGAAGRACEASYDALKR
jgi:hypothetical protein